jgi:hypothetical protein
VDLAYSGREAEFFRSNMLLEIDIGNGVEARHRTMMAPLEGHIQSYLRSNWSS